MGNNRRENKFLWLPEVNYVKSIAKEKLIYNYTSGDKFFYGYLLAILLFLATGSLYTTYDVIQHDDNFIPFVVAIALSCWLVINLFHLNTFVKVAGRHSLLNKENMITTLNHIYTDLKFEESKENLLRDIQLPGFLTAGSYITVLFYKEYVYINRGHYRVQNANISIFRFIKLLQMQENSPTFSGSSIKRIS